VSAYDEDKGKGVLRNAVVRLGYEAMTHFSSS